MGFWGFGGLRYRRYIPAGGQDNRVAEAVQSAVEHKLAVRVLVGGIIQGASDFDVRALFVVNDGDVQFTAIALPSFTG